VQCNWKNAHMSTHFCAYTFVYTLLCIHFCAYTFVRTLLANTLLHTHFVTNIRLRDGRIVRSCSASSECKKKWINHYETEENWPHRRRCSRARCRGQDRLRSIRACYRPVRSYPGYPWTSCPECRLGSHLNKNISHDSEIVENGIRNIDQL
jgi:hypothetical protein